MKMKNIIIFSVICSILALGGCKDSFLDQDPPLYLEDKDISKFETYYYDSSVAMNLFIATFFVSAKK